MKHEAGFKLYGIFGYPLGHTLSPAMQEAAFEALGLKAYYLVLELGPNSFRKVMRKLSRLPLEGFNITVPHKGEVRRYLKGHLTPEARAMGAVNTVFRKNGKWWGANTDAYGFLTSLRKDGRFLPRGKNVLILGAGGSARAVAYGLAKQGARKIIIANRTVSRARRIVRDFRRLFPWVEWQIFKLPQGFRRGGVTPPLQVCLNEAHLIVNATSVGLKRNGPSLIPGVLIPKAARGRKLFFDLIYHRPETEFLKSAKRKGHRTVNGVGMLLHQGARAFELWTGKKPPIAVMRKALLTSLRGGRRPTKQSAFQKQIASPLRGSQ